MSWAWDAAFAPKLTEGVAAANSLGVAIALYYVWRDGAGGLVLAIAVGAAMVGLFMSAGLAYDWLEERRDR